MLDLLKGIFTAGPIKSMENVALEWIQTNKENAEARALILKALDQNGAMRRHISKMVARLYAIYLLYTLALLTWTAFTGNSEGVKLVAQVTDLFVPITTLFTVICTASFGVNYANVKKGV